MKSTIYLFILSCISLLLFSCENTIEAELYSSTEKITNEVKTTLATADTVPFQLEETEELKALKERMLQLKKTELRSAAYSNYDNYFSSNMYAIRELPLTLQARGAVNTSNRYLSANGKGQEITLSSTAIGTAQRFYVKVLPASTGIPFLIYSSLTGTPLSVGQYNNAPTNKILFARNDDTGSLYSASWDILPATNYPGYYFIQSQSYLGQSDPNNMWSVFNYVLEAKANSKLGYGQYTRKAEQEFIIKPDANFELKDIMFVNEYNAVVTRKADFSITRSWSNSESRTVMKDFIFEEFVNEYSNFTENKTIAFNIIPSTVFFRRPTVTKDKIDFVPDLSKSPDTYYLPYQMVSNRLYAVVPLRIAPKTKLYATYYFKTFEVEADYVATIRYGGREAKISGRWKGLVHVDEIFEVDTDPVDLSTNLSRGIERINVINTAKLNSTN